LKTKVDNFNKDVMDSSQKNYDALKVKSERATSELKSYLGNAKALLLDHYAFCGGNP
jgi:hypothetical protein